MSLFSSRVYKEFDNWGEIANQPVHVVPDKVYQTVITGAVKPENPKIKLPVTENEDGIITLPPELTRQHEFVRYTIKLNQHARAVQRLLRITTANKNDFRTCPPVPDIFGRKRKMLKNQPTTEVVITKRGPFKFIIGQGPPLPLLFPKTIDDMLRKAVITILAQAGFDRAESHTVTILVDVLKEVMRRLSRTLHELSQQDILSIRFRDSVEKSLKDVGMSGIASLITYWQKQVLGRKNKAHNKSCVLFSTYAKLVTKLVSQFANQSYHPFSHSFQHRSLRAKQGKLRSNQMKEGTHKNSRLYLDTFSAVPPSSSWQL